MECSNVSFSHFGYRAYLIHFSNSCFVFQVLISAGLCTGGERRVESGPSPDLQAYGHRVPAAGCYVEMIKGTEPLRFSRLPPGNASHDSCSTLYSPLISGQTPSVGTILNESHADASAGL